MGLFKKRGHSPADPGAPASMVDDATPIIEEAAEERQEHDDDVEVAWNRRGLRGRWGLARGDDEVARREARAVADPESDTAERLFIQSEREAEQRHRYDE